MLEWVKQGAQAIFVLKLSDKITEMLVESLDEEQIAQLYKWFGDHA